uniref:Uncharacterized protein n=1 Tax=Oncorhynchus mykiss TaxID=8022 RepID=A0A8L0DWA3_ONCMY
MYCLESEWFSWPWIRPSSFYAHILARVRTQPNSQRQRNLCTNTPPVSPAQLSSPPASAPPSPPLYSTERGKRVVEEKRQKEKNYLWRKA